MKKINYFFCIIALSFVVLAICGGFLSYTPVPYNDMWDGYLNFYANFVEKGISAFWEQHNEHRILLSNIFFWMDIRFFNGNGKLLIVINYCLLISICGLFLKVWNEKRIGYKNLDWLIFFIIAWLFSWAQKANLSWGFQSQFYLVQLLPMMGFYLLYLSGKGQKNSILYFVLACFFGMLSVGTMANGILALPLMFVFAILARFKFNACFALAVLACLTLWLFFLDYQISNDDTSLVVKVFQNPIKVVAFVMLYLGSPFFYIFQEGISGAVIAGGAGGFLVISAGYFVLKEVFRKKLNPLNLFLLLCLAFLCGSAVITALGRIHLVLGASLTSRYTTPALIAWSILFLLYIPILDKINQRTNNKLYWVFLVLLIPMLYLQLSALDPERESVFEQKIAALSLEMNIKDAEQVYIVYPDIDRVLKSVKSPRNLNISIFGDTEIKDINQQINQSMNAIPERQCDGEIDEVVTVKEDPRYLRIRGRISSEVGTEQTEMNKLLFVDSNNTIVGAGLKGQAPVKNGFKGYVLSSLLDQEVSIVSLKEDCVLRTTVSLSLPVFVAKMNSTNTDIAKSDQILQKKGWGTNKVISENSNLLTFSSRVTNQYNRGSIFLKMKRGQSILLKTGKITNRQSLTVINQPKFSPEKLPYAEDWIALHFNNPNLPEEFEIEISDNGRQVDEWAEIAVIK